ncbi:MAG: hypothetical protein ABW170_24515 [Candidatus Thiodiazotropha sp. L084R]
MLTPIKLFLSTALMALAPLYAAEKSFNTQEQFERVLRDLPGHWNGEAVETPVGPMNYDIVFHNCTDGAIAGVAKTGASLHYWRFIPRQDGQLQFLSTFMGNRTPTLLLLRASNEDRLFFYAPQRKILTLEIRYAEPNIDIQVFHHEKPHVLIKLSKSAIKPAHLAPHYNQANSCKALSAESVLQTD